MEYECGRMELVDPCGYVEVVDYCAPDMSMTKAERLDSLKSYKTTLEKEVRGVDGQIKKLRKSK